MTNYPSPFFNRGAVQPLECLKQGWALVKERYWLFVGMSAVAILIASVVPLGILMGPMMCGLYLSLFKVRRGHPVEFGDLFKGFDFFGPSLIATLIHILPIVVIFVPAYIAFYVSVLVAIPQPGSDGDPTALFAVFGAFAIFYVIILAVMILIAILFTYTYPLIVDRKLSGVEAVKLSAKAALGNFGRLFGMYLLNALLSMAGVLLCYVGVFLILPITIAATAVAYEQTFGLGESLSDPLPPPPPTFT